MICQRGLLLLVGPMGLVWLHKNTFSSFREKAINVFKTFSLMQNKYLMSNNTFSYFIHCEKFLTRKCALQPYNCQAPGPGPGLSLVLTWSYHGLVPFLVKTWPGVDTIIKEPTHHPTPNFFKALVALSRQVLGL